MTTLRIWISRMLDLLFSGRRERRLDEEIRTHLDLLTDQYVAAGMPPAEARQAARRSFGGVDRIKEVYRDQRGVPVLEVVGQDVRFAFRLLRRNPGFALTAILVLGAGIGVNNMLFTILNAHTLRGLPIPDSQRVLFFTTIDGRGSERGVSFPDYRDIAEGVRHYRGVAAFRPEPMAISGDGHAAERFDGAFVSANAFDLIGTQPIFGRGLSASDDTPGAAGVAVLGRSAWETRYGADPAAIGRAININGRSVTLIGVMPDRSGFPGTAVIWMPLWQAPALATETRDARTLQVFGRVADGSTVDAARAEVGGIADRLAMEHPGTNRNTRARIVPINSRFLGSASDPVWRAFMTLGFIVVLISCANVANLMLDRSLLRGRELAIRTSVGGTRRRLVRQLLVEGAVIAASGAAVGLLVGIAGVRGFRAAIPGDALPYWFDYSVDWRVLAVLIGVAALTVFVFALVPAIQASRTDVIAVLKDGGRSNSPGRRRFLAPMFLAAQLALAVVLLAHFAVNLRSGGPGPASDVIFDDRAIVTATLTLPAATFPTPASRSAFYGTLLGRLRGVPAFAAAALTTTVPLSGGESRNLTIDGKSSNDEKTKPTTLTSAVTAGYFRALGLEVLQGRDFEDADGRRGLESAIVNEQFAQKFLAGEAVIGRRVALGPPDGTSTGTVPWLTIVGVAPSIRQGRSREPDPVVYLPFGSTVPASAALIVRSGLDTAGAVTAIRRVVQGVDPALPVYRARTMPELRHDAEWVGQVSNNLFTFLTFIAVALATVGLYAVAAHTVSRERKEIGIRIALGARTRQIVGRVLRRLLGQAAFGFGGGVLLTALWDRTFSSGSVDIQSTDLGPLAIVVAILLGVFLLAAIVPSRRASRVDPLIALRVD
jgi:predicted permease